MRVLDTADVKDVTALAFSPDGRYAATGAQSLGLVVHDLTGGSAVRIGPDEFHSSAVVEFEPEGSLATVTTHGRTIYDPATGEALRAGPHDPDGPRPMASFAASADGTRLVTHQYWYPRSRLTCWHATGGGWEHRWFVDDTPSRVNPAVSPAGDRVAAFEFHDTQTETGFRLVVRDTGSGEVVGAGSYPYPPRLGTRFRPDGWQIVVPHDAILVVWDARRLGKPVLVRNDTRHHFTAAAYHPSGRYLFTTSNDATVTVWDTDDWVRVKRFAWDIGRLRSVAVSADGLLAAAGSDRGRVVVWDVDV